MSQQKAAILLCLLFFFSINITQLKSRPATVDDFDSLKHIYGRYHIDSYNLIETVESVASLSPEHSPAYYLILHVWLKLAGDDLFSARLLSVFLGLLAVALVYRLALLTRNRRVALAAPLVIATIAFFQYYSQIARVYAPFVLVCGWVIWSYWQAVNSTTDSRWQWFSLFAAAATILYVHYLGLLILAAIAVYHLVFVPKGRRWFQGVLVLAAAGLSFAPWLPVFIHGFTRAQSPLSKSALSLPEALMALLEIFSNGIWILPLVAIAALWLHRRRLNRAEVYLVALTAFCVLILLAVHLVTPLLIERRMRYALVLAVPYSCCLAIAFSRMPGWRILSLPLFAGWIGASVVFAGSVELRVYTNRGDFSADIVPHYQDFIYEDNILPGNDELILSFHPRMDRAIHWAMVYYRTRLTEWAHIAHMALDANSEVAIHSAYSTWQTVDNVSENSLGVWLLHNPTQTGIVELETYFGWFLERFKFCKRFVDNPETIIDYYLRSTIPCDLVTEEQPFAIRYDNGTELGNLVYEHAIDHLSVYLKWLQPSDKVDAFTLQIFNGQGNRVRQFDKVISGEPIDIVTFDVDDLAEGDYAVKLIVYNRESLESLSGVIARNQQAFERDVEALRFSIRK